MRGTTKLREYSSSLAILAVIKVFQDPLQMIRTELRHPILVFIAFLADLHASGSGRRTLALCIFLFKVLPHQAALHHEFVGSVSSPILWHAAIATPNCLAGSHGIVTLERYLSRALLMAFTAVKLRCASASGDAKTCHE
jgi:hypothetical protein